MEQSTLKFTARNDYAFKKMFGREENKEILCRFLSLILDIDEESITDIVYKNTFIGGNYKRDKHGIIDIKIELNKVTILNIEMQNIWHNYYEERVLFGWANSYIEEINRGESYATLKKCISINVLNSKFPYSDEVHSVYKILNIRDYTSFKDILELHFLDLTMLDKNGEKLSELEKWLLFIETDNEEVREILAKEDKIMEKANIMMKEFYSNPQERALYLAEFRDACDRTTIFDDGVAIGEKRGVAIGESRGVNIGMSNIVLYMNKKGMSLNEIAENTGLDKDTILSFINKEENV